MRKLKLLIISISILLIFLALIYTDYRNLVSRENLNCLIAIIVSILNIVALTLPFRQATRKKN
jgi:hypothetical protein